MAFKHPIWVPVQFLAALLPNQLLVCILGKQKMAEVLGVLQKKLLAPSYGSVHLWPCGYLRSEPRIFPVSPLLYVTAFQI